MQDDIVGGAMARDHDNTKDLTTVAEDKMLEVVEFDVIGDEEGRFECSVEIDARASLVSALFNGDIAESSIGGRIDDRTFLGGRDSFRDSNEESGAVLCTEIEPVGNGTRCRLVFSGILEAGGRAKVYVLVLFRRIREYWRETSCDDCKKIVKFLLAVTLLFAGFGDISLVDVIPEGFWGWIGANQLPEAVTRILENVNPDLIVMFPDVLRELADLFNIATTPIPSILSLICRMLGFCDQAA